MITRYFNILGICIVFTVCTFEVEFIQSRSVVKAGEFNDLLGEAVERGTQVDAARARQDAAEASVRKAWSKFLPSVSATGEFGYNRNNAFGRFDHLNREQYDNSAYGFSANLPIYRGGANYYGLKEARANAKAEAHSYQEAKQILLLDTVRAILGVIRDREVVALQRENRAIVGSIVRTTQSRFKGGDATRTDIALARDQFTATQSVYTQAIDNLHQNETEFKRLVGRAPGRLSLPRGLHKQLPSSLQVAVDLAEQQNPQLLSALFRSQAAEHALKASYSRFLPSVDLNMDYLEERYHGASLQDENDFAVKLNFSMPLFQPDALPASQESRHVSEQRKFEARDARYTAKAMATVAWRSYHTARKRYSLALARIKAAEAASRGMRRELSAGQRTVLDVLNTQERLVQAKVQASSAKFERYMAAHLLLSATGQLDENRIGGDEFITYVESAQKKRLRKGAKKGEWRLQRANLGGAIKNIKRSKRSVKTIKGVDKAWSIKSVATNAQPFVRRLPLKRANFPILKSRLVERAGDGNHVSLKKPVRLAKKSVKKHVALKPVKATSSFKKDLRRQQNFVSDDRVVTGSIKRGIVPLQKGKLSYGGTAFAIHKIPLPIKKRTEIKAKEIKPARVQGEAYPDTWQNRFSVMWNSGVDAVIGPSGKPKPVLVPLEEYRKKLDKK